MKININLKVEHVTTDLTTAESKNGCEHEDNCTINEQLLDELTEIWLPDSSMITEEEQGALSRRKVWVKHYWPELAESVNRIVTDTL